MGTLLSPDAGIAVRPHTVSRGWHLVLALALVTGPGLSALPGGPPRGGVLQDVRLRQLLADGEAAVKAGNAKLALTHFGAALPLADAAGDELLLGTVLTGLGWAQWASGQYDAALKTRQRALAIYTSRADASREALVRRALGETYYSMGRYDDALEQYRLGLEANRRSPVPLQEGLILSNMGSAYRSQGKLPEAAAALEEALTILRTTGDRPALGQVLTFLGIVNRAQGEFDRALRYYRQALDERRATGDRRGEAQVLGNMANVHLDLGEYATAVERNRQSLAIAEEIGYTVQVGFAHQNLGAALSRIPRPAEALKHYELALQTYRTIGRQAQIPWTLYSIGALQAFHLDDEPGGRQTLAEALRLARDGKYRDAEAYIVYELGSLDMFAGRLEAALEQLNAALAIARELGMADLEYQILANRGLTAQRQGRSADAIADLRASAAIINDLRANVSSDQSKIAYVDTRQSVFHDLAIVLADAGRPEEALEAAEAARGRAFADLLRERQVKGRAGEQQALAVLRAAVEAPAAAEAAAPSGEVRGGDAVVSAVEQVRARNRELASLVAVESPAIADIKAIASRLEATIVEYLVTDRQLLVWVVQPAGTVTLVKRPMTAVALAKQVEALRRALDVPGPAALRMPDAASDQLRRLYQQLVAPIAKWLPAPGRGPLIVVPHGPTALLPFAALEDAAGTPLVARQAMAFAPSLSIFQYTPEKQQRARASAGALIVADPVPPADSGLSRLPGTLDEGTRVARRIGSAATLLKGAAATETAVKSGAGGRRILHLATHGLVSPVRPIASSLALAGGAEDDGYLRLDEIFGLDLAADLVVLSGCSTGLGRLSGDGIFGLTRGFIYAGTPSVVVSNWDVSDRATAYLMDRFYAALLAGRSKAEALADAQRATRKQFRHPSFWAAFVLVGEPR